MTLNFGDPTDVEQLQQCVRGAVAHPYEWRHDPREEDERRCNDSTHTFGSDERNGFGRQLSKDDVKERQNQEADCKRRGRVDASRWRSHSESLEDAIQNPGYCRLT